MNISHLYSSEGEYDTKDGEYMLCSRSLLVVNI